MKKVNVLLAEVVPAGNKGEIAITCGIIEALGSDQDHLLRMFSYNKAYDQPRYGEMLEVIDTKESWPIINSERAGTILWRSLILFMQHVIFALFAKISKKMATSVFRGSAWRAYLEADIILMGHDSNYGIGGDPETPLLYPFYIPYFCSFLNKKTMFIAGTVPRLPNRFKGVFKFLFRKSLKKIDVVTLREENSAQNCLNVGLQSSDFIVTRDIAYLMKPKPKAVGRKILLDENVKLVDGELLVGVTMSWARGKIAYPDQSYEDSYRKHIQMMAKAFDHIIKQNNARIVFVPHSIGPGEKADDRIPGYDVKKLSDHADNIHIIEGEYGAQELKSVLSNFALMIGERLHSVIGASSTGVPSIAISYKIDPRLGMVEPVITSENILHLEGLSTEKIIQRVDFIIANYAEVKSTIEKNAKATIAQSGENARYLMDLIRS